jgi:hypothetical protein
MAEAGDTDLASLARPLNLTIPTGLPPRQGRTAVANRTDDLRRGHSTMTEPLVILRSGKGVVPKQVNWLWHHWLALGKLHVIAGAKGAGKSTLVFSLFAAMTHGDKWPDGTKAPLGMCWSGLPKTTLTTLSCRGSWRWAATRIGCISSTG